MTISEAAARYGVSIYTASAGDDLYSVCRRIYGNEGDLQILVLKTLNSVFCWDDIIAGTEISYVVPELLGMVDEILS